MKVTIDTENKTIILKSGESISLKDVFNFIHKIDADNAEDWKIMSEYCLSYPIINTNTSSPYNTNVSLTNVSDFQRRLDININEING